jgi:hypothetical protein
MRYAVLLLSAVLLGCPTDETPSGAPPAGPGAPAEGDPAAPPPGGEAGTPPAAAPGLASFIKDGKSIKLSGKLEGATKGTVDVQAVDPDNDKQPRLLESISVVDGTFSVDAPATFDGDIYLTAIGEAAEGKPPLGGAAEPVKFEGKDVAVVIKLTDSPDWMKKLPWGASAQPDPGTGSGPGGAPPEGGAAGPGGPPPAGGTAGPGGPPPEGGAAGPGGPPPEGGAAGPGGAPPAAGAAGAGGTPPAAPK